MLNKRLFTKYACNLLQPCFIYVATESDHIVDEDDSSVTSHLSVKEMAASLANKAVSGEEAAKKKSSSLPRNSTPLKESTGKTSRLLPIEALDHSEILLTLSLGSPVNPAQSTSLAQNPALKVIFLNVETFDSHHP